MPPFLQKFNVTWINRLQQRPIHDVVEGAEIQHEFLPRIHPTVHAMHNNSLWWVLLQALL